MRESSVLPQGGHAAADQMKFREFPRHVLFALMMAAVLMLRCFNIDCVTRDALLSTGMVTSLCVPGGADGGVKPQAEQRTDRLLSSNFALAPPPWKHRCGRVFFFFVGHNASNSSPSQN